ncbi:adenosylhomocysteinase [Canibacter sp. lx-45]|uniref:adenosylhomocysteinase n=1 Tax=Canibacter zhuwentaonis TaxID=2837491 RepID=UPI001BDCE6F8|nr:adenosylhomocysteinase [Canibacter zhuwentaonis]MBT1034759.1 adenosylhomocysteinase [Canibacter zhuwentaonis]
MNCGENESAARDFIIAAAKAGNRMIAGAAIVVCAPKRENKTVRALANALKALGGRVTEVENSQYFNGDEKRVDFVFYTAAKDVTGILFTRSAIALPTLYVALEEPPARLCSALEKAGFSAVPKQRAGIVEYANEAGMRVSVLVDSSDPLAASAAAQRLKWAARAMPVTAEMAMQLGDLTGQKILVSLLLEPKTAALAMHLKNTGASVGVFAAVSETDVTVAKTLADEGIQVFAPTVAHSGSAAELDREHAAAALAWGSTLLIDDGSHLIRLAHTSFPAALNKLIGAAEETTSGVRPLVEMATAGELKIPVVAVNNARTKTLFDNRVGTGESCVFAILAELPRSLYGKNWVVWGYGPVGEGVARAARALGNSVQIIETDAVRALAAVTDGYEVITEQSLPEGKFIGVSATGVWHTIGADVLATCADRAVFAVAGGIDDELALDELFERGWSLSCEIYCMECAEARNIRRSKRVITNTGHVPISSQGTRRFIDPAGKMYRGGVIAGGAGVNYTAAEGNPIEVMDLSFATQLAALAQLLQNPSAPVGVLEISTVAESAVAQAALKARGFGVTPERQQRIGGAAQPWQIHRYK